jgi:hypothetical protein
MSQNPVIPGRAKRGEAGPVGENILALADEQMRAADDLYFAMNEAAAIGNRPLVSHYGQRLRDTMQIYHALFERLDGATVN